jgi:hypothetical protein
LVTTVAHDRFYALASAAVRTHRAGLRDPSLGPSSSGAAVGIPWLARVEGLASAGGLLCADYDRHVGYSTTIRERRVSMGLDLDAAEAEALWRILSGLTHGDMWASHSMIDQEEIVPSPDGDSSP